jgi:hypothetical protein
VHSVAVAEDILPCFAKRAGATKGTLARDRTDWTTWAAVMHTRTVAVVLAKDMLPPLSSNCRWAEAVEVAAAEEESHIPSLPAAI